MENSDVLYLTSRSIAQCQPEHKNHQKIEKQKESKPNKSILIAKYLEALNLRQNFLPSKIPISKKCLKMNFVSQIGPVLYLQDLKNIHLPLKID